MSVSNLHWAYRFVVDEDRTMSLIEAYYDGDDIVGYIPIGPDDVDYTVGRRLAETAPLIPASDLPADPD